MEEKFNKLDKFLREHLQDASENNAWNVPDDAIFEKAMRNVAAEKRKKRRGWILLPVLVAAGLLVSEYFHNRRIETLEQKITTLEDNLSRESATTDSLSSTSSNLREGSTSQQANSSIEKQNINSSVAAGETSLASEPKSSPYASLSHESGTPSTASKSGSQSLNKPFPKTKSATTPIAGTIKSPGEITSNSDQTQSNQIATHTQPGEPAKIETSITPASNPLVNGKSNSEDIQDNGVAGLIFTGTWITEPISSLDMKGLESGEAMPFAILPIAANTTNSTEVNPFPVYMMSYGLLFGVNQSWLTMKNVPSVMNTNLHSYENSQPGFSMQGFVNKPFSPRFSFKAGLGYNVYNNKSILEDQFLFDTDHVEQMPDGQLMYQTDYNLVNPIGEYNMLLEFRVKEQMQENDVVVEYTTIEQTIQSVMLDLGVQYDLVTLRDFKLSLGTGLGLGYMAGLKNEFNVSTYHNSILQKTQMETPEELESVNKWYGQWLGSLNIGYYPSRRMGIILMTQYNAGLTSIRDGGSANGPLTFLHAFSLSAGITHSF